ncbi:MAG TPA: GTPase HflX [Negativicutes bacterium]
MLKVYGDTSGLRKNVIERLEQLYETTVPFGQVITLELAQTIADITAQINREIAIYLNKRGQVTCVAIGDIGTVSLPETDGRRSQNRLSGVRCIHTHPNGNSELSGVDIASLKTMRFDIMAALGVSSGMVPQVSFGYINGVKNEKDETLKAQTVGPLELSEFISLDLNYLTAQIERQLETATTNTLIETERAVLVGLERQGMWAVADSLLELAQLAETAGAEVLAKVWQKRERPDAALFIGRGKVQEISLLRQELNANLIIFDDELSPAQQRNLEQSLGIKVLDRAALILDIFAQRARSHEGKLQVELAQLRYNLPRLGGQGLVLSRLGGGIGTRGPGETKLEVDRRRIRTRISDIEKEIENIKKQRNLHRVNRQTSGIPNIALVGYTNSGKSTLLNTLTSAGVLAEDKLFATLDPTTRRIALPNGQEVLLTDTVGFIQKLPHQLIVAFRATLEEVVQADLLLHVVDASHAQYQQQSDAVFRVLKELKADTKPTITAFNKIDKLENQHLTEHPFCQDGRVTISAVAGTGIGKLIDSIEEFLQQRTVDMNLLIPYNDSGVLSRLYDTAVVRSTEYREDGVYVAVSLSPNVSNQYSRYVVGDE